MFELHDTEKQIQFLRELQTEDSKEMIEEIIHDLEFPLEKFSYNEADYQLRERLGDKFDPELALELA